MKSPTDLVAVQALLDEGVDANPSCSYTVRVSGLATLGGVLLAVTVPVVGVLVAGSETVERRRRATPMEWALSHKDLPLFDVLLPVAKLPEQGVNTALTGGSWEMAAQLIEAGADPELHTLAGEISSEAGMRQAKALGARFDGVRVVWVRRPSAAWVTTALELGVPARVLIREVVSTPGSASAEALWVGAPHIGPALARQALATRWDLVLLAHEHGVMEPSANEDTVLMQAAARGSVPDVRRVLALGVDPNRRDRTGRTALHHAALRGTASMARALNPVDVSILDDSKKTALSRALRSERLAFAGVLLDAGAGIDDAALNAAVAKPAALRFLLDRGLDPDHIGSDGRSLVVRVIKQDASESWALLKPHRPELNGATPDTHALQQALASHHREDWTRRVLDAGGKLSTVPDVENAWGGVRQEAFGQMLLEEGLPPNEHMMDEAIRARDVERLSALLRHGGQATTDHLKQVVWHSKGEKDRELAALLLEAGVDPDEDGLLHVAVKQHDADLVDLLLEHGASVSQRDSLGDTLLHNSLNNPEQLKRWVDLGAELELTSRGATPLALALSKGKEDAARVLLEAGARGDCETSWDDCLSLASSKDMLDLFGPLLDGGADVHASPRFPSDRPLMKALSAERMDVVDVLLSKGAKVTPELVLHLMQTCDLERAAATRDRWPEGVKAAKAAGRAKCKAMKPILRKEGSGR